MEEHFFGGVKIPFMDYIKMTLLSVIGVEFRDKILQLGHYAPLFGHQDLNGEKNADLILEDVNGYLTNFNVQKRFTLAFSKLNIELIYFCQQGIIL